MAEIVSGVGASHSTLMNTHWDQAIHKDRAKRFRDALGEARDRIAARQPDVALIVGSNHFRGFWLDLIPAFTMGVGECTASGESGTPSGPQPVDVPLARHIAGTLVEGGRFDIAWSARLQIDHGQSQAIQYLLAGLDIPIIPLVVNVFAPPLPTTGRCERTRPGHARGHPRLPRAPPGGGHRLRRPVATGCRGRTGVTRTATTRSSWCGPGWTDGSTGRTTTPGDARSSAPPAPRSALPSTRTSCPCWRAARHTSSPGTRPNGWSRGRERRSGDPHVARHGGGAGPRSGPAPGL